LTVVSVWFRIVQRDQLRIWGAVQSRKTWYIWSTWHTGTERRRCFR